METSSRPSSKAGVRVRVDDRCEPPISRYDEMLLENDKNVPHLESVAAKLCSWLLLAGYLVFPSTFASLSESHALSGAGKAGTYVSNTVKNVPCLYVASFCCGIAATGLAWLWWKWNRNYICLVNRIVIPTLANSAMGLLTTLLNVYAVHGGDWSVTAIVTAAIIGTWLAASCTLYIVYDQCLLKKLRRTPLPGTEPITCPHSS
ncbi:hypothetical protein NKR23_g12311 [Pleurostoma richardsiae]|uniref:Transmembrane protein n=1 Tax=Pleurostoma richardsiae TaxID=41990 RepID=A0AA38R205_9PEZI|nr:hypothetical protein NKR23_g12311 [Pleurostoma richardsiae]